MRSLFELFSGLLVGGADAVARGPHRRKYANIGGATLNRHRWRVMAVLKGEGVAKGVLLELIEAGVAGAQPRSSPNDSGGILSLAQIDLITLNSSIVSLLRSGADAVNISPDTSRLK